MNMRVIVAGRDDWLEETVRKHLERSGCEVATAHDGLGCMDILATSEPHAVILEDGLLWGNADGVVACLQEEEVSSSVPVILILDKDASDEPADWIDAPLVACLRKPFHPSELMDCLSSLSVRDTEPVTEQSSRR